MEGNMRDKARLLAILLLFIAINAQERAPLLTEISKRVITTLKIPGYVDFLVADGKAVWATNEGRIEKLEHNRSKPTAVVTVPAPCGAMALGFGSVWVANCSDNSLYRIDCKSERVKSIIPTGLADLTGELSVAVGAGSVWVLSESKGILSRVDPQSDKVIARINVAPYSYAAAFGFDAVWISNTGPPSGAGKGFVQRIDPRSNQVVATIPVGSSPRFLTVGEGGVWTLNQGDGSISRIDPITNTLSATVQAGIIGPGGDIAAGAGSVWVRGTKILLLRIDPETNKVVEEFGPPAGSGAVRVADGLVWITAHDIQTVWVLRPGKMGN
jgi:virginiamycin B lyase